MWLVHGGWEGTACVTGSGISVAFNKTSSANLRLLEGLNRNVGCQRLPVNRHCALLVFGMFSWEKGHLRCRQHSRTDDNRFEGVPSDFGKVVREVAHLGF